MDSKTTSPLVSIITPSFNSRKYIAETIESVVHQDYPAIEHIVIDGNSTDGTQEVLNQYPQIKWISESDKGQSDAINKGLKMASGEIIGWLNADDLYTSQAISTAVNFLRNHQDAVAVYGDMKMIDEKGAIIFTRRSQLFNLERLFLHNFINQPTVFIRKRIINQVGGIDTRLHYSMDRELWLRIGSQNRMDYLPCWVGAEFRVHPSSKTSTSEPRFHAEWAGVMESTINNPLYRDVPMDIKRRAIEQAYVRLKLSLIRKALEEKRISSLLSITARLIIEHRAYILKYPVRKFL